MREAVAALVIVSIFIFGVAVGLFLSRHCCIFAQQHTLQSATDHVQLEEVQIDLSSKPDKRWLHQSQAKSMPVAYSFHASAVGTAQEVTYHGLMPRRTTSREVESETYRTGSALSNQLDEIEERPQLARLRSKPSIKDPERLIDANYTNPTIEVHMDEIDLREQVGKGGQGAVYKGTWRGAPVAVKYAICDTEDVDVADSVLHSLITGHPNVVQTYAWTVLSGLEACGAAAMDNEGSLVKAALCKTNISASLNGNLGQNASMSLDTKRDACTPLVARQLVSPFANGVADRFSEEGGSKAAQPAGASRPYAQVPRAPVENISPLFERMLLESLQAGSGEDAHVKRRLDLSVEGGDDSLAGNSQEPPVMGEACSGGSDSSCEQLPMGIDELLFRAQPQGASAGRLPAEAARVTEDMPGEDSGGKVGGGSSSDEASTSSQTHLEQVCTPAMAPTRSAGVCPAPQRSFLSRGSSRSGLYTPLQTGRARSPDSFNRRAAPGSSLLDETEATPKLQRRYRASQNEGTMHLPPRARRRIMFGHGRQSPALGFNGPPSPKASTPEDKGQGPSLAAAESPADTDALLGERHGGCGRAPDSHCNPVAAEMELEAVERAHSMESCSSFNSEEGFGSPMAGRKRRTGFAMDSYDGKEAQAVMVIVMEFCDLQSLHRAITKKAFKPHGKWSKQTTYRALLRTAQEIALGMTYIHGSGIVHGDLKPQNVLLKTHRIDRRGYIAKISDFGLSCPAEGSNAGYALGTIAFTAPEKFLDHRATKASDVFAFGILLWEMYYCTEAYESLMAGQICHGVVYESLRPEFDSDCHPAYRALASRCWHQEPECRPSFKDIVVELRDIEVAFRAGCHRQKKAKCAG